MIAAFAALMLLSCQCFAIRAVMENTNATNNSLYLNTAATSSYLLIGGQEIVTGTSTIKGNAFSVGGSTFAVTNGQVGIGTNSPAYNLHIRGSIPAIALGDTAGGGATWVMSSGNSATGNFDIIQSAVSNRFSILGSNGNVGIGTVIPSSILTSSYSYAGSFTGNPANSGFQVINYAAGSTTTIVMGGNGTGSPVTAIVYGNNTAADSLLLTPRNATCAGLTLDGNGSVRLTNASCTISTMMASITSSSNQTCTTTCGGAPLSAGTCISAWTSGGSLSTCATSAANQRCLCAGFGN